MGTSADVTPAMKNQLNETYLSELKKDNSPHLLAWQLVSFFALDVESQRAAVGPCEQWFVKENSSNAGANYFTGMVLLLCQTGYGHHFDDWALAEANEMEEILMRIHSNLDIYNWSAAQLQQDHDWTYLQTIANAMVSKARIWVNPPKKPLWFPDYMEIY